MVISAWCNVVFIQQSARNNVQDQECKGAGVAPRSPPRSPWSYSRSSVINAAGTTGDTGHAEGARTETRLPLMSFHCIPGLPPNIRDGVCATTVSFRGQFLIVTGPQQAWPWLLDEFSQQPLPLPRGHQ